MTALQAEFNLGAAGNAKCSICAVVRQGVPLFTFTPAGNRRPGVHLCWRCLAAGIDAACDVNVTNQVDQWLWMKSNAKAVREGKPREYQRPKPRRKDAEKRQTKRARSRT